VRPNALRFRTELEFKTVRNLGWKRDKARPTEPARIASVLRHKP